MGKARQDYACGCLDEHEGPRVQQTLPTLVTPNRHSLDDTRVRRVTSFCYMTTIGRNSSDGPIFR